MKYLGLGLFIFGLCIGCFSSTESEENDVEASEESEAANAENAGDDATEGSEESTEEGEAADSKISNEVSEWSAQDKSPVLTPNDEYLTCEKDSDCIKLKNIGCDSCCQETAINRNHKINYAKDVMLYCNGFRGDACDCQQPTSQAKCVSGKCTIETK